VKYNSILKAVQKKVGNKVTSGVTLQNAGKHYFKSDFLGVFPVDVQVNSIISKAKAGKQSYFILNTDPGNKPGQHWIGVVYDGENRMYIYDSFGRKSKTLLKTFVNNLNKKKYSHKDSDYDSEQRDSEENCGSRSLAWLLYAKQYGLTEAMKI